MTMANHPRLILDASNLARVKQTDLSAIKAWCDYRLSGRVEPPTTRSSNNAPDISPGYEGEEYAEAVLNFAVAYQATGNTDYGDKCVAIMLAMSDGTSVPSTDSGYIVRNYARAYAIGYDFVFDRMTAAQRTQIFTDGNRFIGYWENDATYETQPIAGNYFCGYFAAKVLFALATYDENPKAHAQWDDCENNLFPALAADFAKHLAGGGWPEGFQYGPLVIEELSLAAWGVKTATGQAPAFPFPIDCGPYVVHATWPDESHIDDRDLVHSGDNARTNPDMLAQIQAVLNDAGDTFADIFRGLSIMHPAVSQLWRGVLYHDGVQHVSTPGEPSYFARGMGTVFARSSWAKDATWLSYRGAAFAGDPDAGEQLYDQGSLAIMNGGQPVLVNPWGAWMRSSQGQSIENKYLTPMQQQALPCFNVFMTDKGGQTSNRDAATKTVFKENGTWAYAKTTALEQMYRREVTTWTREVVYLRPGIIVVRDQTADSGTDRWLQWQVPEATINGKTVNLGAGQMDVPYPPDVNIKASSAPDGFNATRRIEVRSPTYPGVWVTVFQTGTPQAVTCSDGDTVSIGDQTVMFADDGVTVNGQAPSTAPSPSPSPAPAPSPAPVPSPPGATTISHTRKGRWQVVGGGAHDTDVEAFEDADNLALAAPGEVIEITPPSYEVTAK